MSNAVSAAETKDKTALYAPAALLALWRAVAKHLMVARLP